jgi:hypothetical protein
MKATKALPTEDRVQRMNDQQWLWYYLNLVEDEQEDEKRNKARMDYMGWWVNPELAKRVSDHEKMEAKRQRNQAQGITEEEGLGARVEQDPNDPNKEIVYHETVKNDSFDEEVQRALAEAGLNPEEAVELPDSTGAGDPTESQEDFLKRVMAMQGMMGIQEPSLDGEALKKAGIDPDDIDYFEYPDEE